MRELLRTKSFKRLSILLVLICVFIIASAVSGNSLISNLFSSVTGGLQEVAAEGTKQISKKSRDELLAENAELETEIAMLRTQLVDYYETKEENARLWRYYDFKKEYPQYKVLPASVVRREAAEDFYAFTINQGTSDGVSVGDPVVTDKGLVGWVYAADRYTSRVKTLLSPDAKVGAINIVSRDSGVVSGDVTLADSGLFTMSKIPAQNTMKQGEIIVTTGVSGMYPSALVIGEVSEIKFDEYDTSKYAVIKPFEDLRTVTDVAVITDFEGKGEISDKVVDDIIPRETVVSTSSVPSTETQAAGE